MQRAGDKAEEANEIVCACECACVCVCSISKIYANANNPNWTELKLKLRACATATAAATLRLRQLPQQQQQQQYRRWLWLCHHNIQLGCLCRLYTARNQKKESSKLSLQLCCKRQTSNYSCGVCHYLLYSFAWRRPFNMCYHSYLSILCCIFQ